MLTPRELQQIREYLLQYGKKDSQFPVVSEMIANDLIAFVRSNKNLAVHLEDIKNFIATAIADEGVYDSEGNPLVMSEENFTKILNEKLDEIQGGAQVNIIEQVKVNNTPLPVDEDKSINIDLEHYVTDDIVSEYASTSNKLVDKNYVDTSIAQSSATFRGTSAPGLTEQEFLAWANNLTHDLNDYVFWKTLVVGSTDEYIYHRYKWDGTDWNYEYDLIPYYLDTEDYPVANSEKAVKSSGIFAFTGDVHKDSNNNYISLQTQIDEIVAGGATINLTVSPSVALADGTNKSFTFTASASKPATVVFNGGAPVSFTGSTTFNEILNSATPTSRTYSASFTINGVVVGTKTATAQLAWKVSSGYGTGDYTTAVLTEASQVKASPAGNYTINIGSMASHIFFKVQSSMTINKVETVGAVTYAVDMDSPVTVDGWKYYRSTSTFDAGTFTFKVS